MVKFLIITFFLVLASATGYHFYLKQQTPVTVEIIHANKGEVASYVRLTGKVVNDKIVKLAALVNGEIKSLKVNVGDTVKKNQLLVSFDNTVNLHQIKRAKAEVNLQTHALKASKIKLIRLKKLTRSGAIAKEKLDEAQTEILLSQARLSVARENLAIENLRIKKTKLYAPYAGVITEKLTGTGQWTEAGTRLLVLASNEGREIEAQVDAGDFLTIKIGSIVSISADSHPNKSWKGKIRRISPAVSSKADANTFPVRISLEADAPKLLLNQQVDIKLTTAKNANALNIPISALIEEDEKYFVMIVDTGKAKKVAIKTGIESYTHVEITQGIDSNTQIILLDEGQILKQGEVVSVYNQAQ